MEAGGGEKPPALPILLVWLGLRNVIRFTFKCELLGLAGSSHRLSHYRSGVEFKQHTSYNTDTGTQNSSWNRFLSFFFVRRVRRTVPGGVLRSGVCVLACVLLELDPRAIM